jgi:hypothetical protein
LGGWLGATLLTISAEAENATAPDFSEAAAAAIGTKRSPHILPTEVATEPPEPGKRNPHHASLLLIDPPRVVIDAALVRRTFAGAVDTPSV